MRYTTLTYFQLFILTLFTGVLAGAIAIGHRMYSDLVLLPVVTLDGLGECVKVTNFNNGHAFTCPDKDVLLRRYRIEK